MAQRVYWIGLLTLVRKLCLYWTRYSGKMPTDLPAAVAVSMASVTVACAALEAYDRATAGGAPSNV